MATVVAAAVVLGLSALFVYLFLCDARFAAQASQRVRAQALEPSLRSFDDLDDAIDAVRIAAVQAAQAADATASMALLASWVMTGVAAACLSLLFLSLRARSSACPTCPVHRPPSSLQSEPAQACTFPHVDGVAVLPLVVKAASPGWIASIARLPLIAIRFVLSIAYDLVCFALQGLCILVSASVVSWTINRIPSLNVELPSVPIEESDSPVEPESPVVERREWSMAGSSAAGSEDESSIDGGEKAIHGDSDTDSLPDGASEVTPDNAFVQDTEDDEDSDADIDEDVKDRSLFDDDDCEDLGPEDESLIANTQRNKGQTSVLDHLKTQDSLFSPVEHDLPNLIKRAFLGNGSTSSAPKKSKKSAEALQLVAGYPVFEQNRCTVTIEHGDPARLAGEAKRTRSYLVASDTSTEAEYALQWAVGTCLRQGDLLHVVSVMESESKLDHEITSISSAGELKAKQRERLDRVQALQRIIVGLLERTRLHVTVIVQAIHASHARRMIIDVIDFTSPTMVIIGSRGLTGLKTSLLGSVSSYIVAKSSVPVMVARRRLRAPAAHRSKAELDRQPRTTLENAETEKESTAGITNEETDPDAPDDQGRADPPTSFSASVDDVTSGVGSASASRENLFADANDQVSEVLRRHGRHRLSPRPSVSSGSAPPSAPVPSSMSNSPTLPSSPVVVAEPVDMERSRTT